MLKLIFFDPKKPPIVRSQYWPILEGKREMPEGPTEEANEADDPSTQYMGWNWLCQNVPTKLDFDQHLHCQAGHQ